MSATFQSIIWVRAIDRFVDLSEIRAHLRPFYSETGRPSIDPELMIRMLLIGYCFGIRSERRLCEEVHLNLAYRTSAATAPSAAPTSPIIVGFSDTRVSCRYSQSE